MSLIPVIQTRHFLEQWGLFLSSCGISVYTFCYSDV